MQELQSWVGHRLGVCNSRSAERNLGKGNSQFLFAHFHGPVALTPYQGPAAVEGSAEGVGPQTGWHSPAHSVRHGISLGWVFPSIHMRCLTLVLHPHRHLHGLLHSRFQGEDTEGSCLL